MVESCESVRYYVEAKRSGHMQRYIYIHLRSTAHACDGRGTCKGPNFLAWQEQLRTDVRA